MNTADSRETLLTIKGEKFTVRTTLGGKVRTVEQLEAAHMRRVKDAIAVARLSERYPEKDWPRDSPQWAELVKDNRPSPPSYSKHVTSFPKLTYFKSIPKELLEYHETIAEREIVMARKVVKSVTCDACEAAGLGSDVPAVETLSMRGEDIDLCEAHGEKFAGWLFQAFGREVPVLAQAA
ncbi:hypothetical protein [Streptomyces sp. NPDC047990]|uniref:hypothetical protein n=1 Tax=Streptomyces sp. NPDC047990 TaxID=3365496 RepID=UPI0037164C58